MSAVFLARVDLIQLGLVEVLSQICETQWAYGEPTEDALPDSLYTLTWMGSRQTQDHQRASSIYTLDSFDLEVDASAVGRELAIKLNGTPYRATATDASPATLRNLLFAAILSDETPAYEVATLGASGLRVTPLASGSLLSASILAGADLATPTTDFASEPHLVTRVTTDVTIQLQAWASSHAPRLSASLLLAHGRSLLQGPTATASLLDRGCVIRSFTSDTDLTAIAGAAWASRSALELQLAYEAQLVTPATRIQTTPALLEISA